MLQEALQKLTAEISSADKRNKYVPVIGGFLMNHLRENPEHAELVLDESKSIQGSLTAMMEEARKVAVNGCGMLTDEEGFAVVLKYFGLSTESPQPVTVEVMAQQPKNFNLQLDDLL